MLSKKQIIVLPLKDDFETRVVRFPPRTPKLDCAGKPIAQAQRSSLSSLTSPRNRITLQFAYDLLQAEMQLQTSESISKQVATHLFELYKVGIQHYNSRRCSKKQNFFKKKLNGLTNHPSVLGMLYSQQQNLDAFYKKRQIQRLIEISNKEATESVQNMIKRIEVVEVANKRTIQKNLSNQMEQIRKRLEKRKISSRPTSATMNQQDQSIPASPLPIKKPKKGSASFATPDPKSSLFYDNLLVDRYHKES